MFLLELFGIWLPIAFHALYGFYIWYRGEGNTVSYPWTGNWMYTLQRWTGGIAFVYIVWHTYTMRFTGIDLHDNPGASFGKVQAEVLQTPLFLFYVVGLIAASWHFAYGIWLFSAKWGIVSGDKAQKRLLRCAWRSFSCCCAVGLASLTSFRSRPVADDDQNRAMIQSTEARHAKRPTERGRNNMAAPKIIVVGGGLAGLSAVIKIAEMGGQVDLFSIVPVKRSHSVCAQGGINAAKNLKGEGDSTWQAF